MLLMYGLCDDHIFCKNKKPIKQLRLNSLYKKKKRPPKVVRLGFWFGQVSFMCERAFVVYNNNNNNNENNF